MSQTYFLNALKYVQTLYDQKKIAIEEKQILKLVIMRQDDITNLRDKQDAITQVSQKLNTLRKIRRNHLSHSHSLNQITEKSMEVDSW